MTFSPIIAALVITAVIIEGFFSGAELALLSADKILLKMKSKQGDPGAALALKMLKNPDRILSTTLLMTNTCIMTISVLLTLEFQQKYPKNAEILAILTGSALVIIFGELIPKFFYRKHSSTLAPKIARPIFIVQGMLSPFIYLTSIYTSQISKVMAPIEKLWSGKRSAKDELQGLLSPEASDTRIRITEKRLIKKILKFRDKIATDGLLPLVQVDAIAKNATLKTAFEIYDRTKHSKLPVYDERIDNILGTLQLTDIIHAQDVNQEITAYIQPAFYVSETQKLEDILNEMLEKDSKIAIVVDEYGGAIGILTREDIFETIVGDLQDEDDLESRSIRSTAPNEWLVKGRTSILQLNEECFLDLPEGDYDTLGGFLLRQFSRIPNVGDELYFDTRAGQLKFTVRDASTRRIESVAIVRIPKES